MCLLLLATIKSSPWPNSLIRFFSARLDLVSVELRILLNTLTAVWLDCFRFFFNSLADDSSRLVWWSCRSCFFSVDFYGFHWLDCWQQPCYFHPQFWEFLRSTLISIWHNLLFCSFFFLVQPFGTLWNDQHSAIGRSPVTPNNNNHGDVRRRLIKLRWISRSLHGKSAVLLLLLRWVVLSLSSRGWTLFEMFDACYSLQMLIQKCKVPTVFPFFLFYSKFILHHKMTLHGQILTCIQITFQFLFKYIHTLSHQYAWQQI